MPVYLSLGSNLGDRFASLKQAVEALEALPEVRVTAVSGIYESEPLGELNQPAFLNAVVEVETALEPLELLDIVQVIEVRLGRTPSRRWGPRVIDIDLILWDNVVMTSERLTLPHAEFRGRAFVLTPLAEIAPTVRDPMTGWTITELAQSSDAQGKVRRLDVPIA